MSDPLAALSRAETRLVRAALIAATAQAGRPDLDLSLPTVIEGVDLPALVEATLLHRVSGTVLTGLDGVELPAEVAGELRRYREAAGLGHLMSVGALSEIADAFGGRGLRWVVMKGPVLAARLYPDPGDRTYGDIDLLVDQRDYAAAVEALEGLGYAHDVRDWARAEDVMAGQLGLARPGMDVDLHWQLHYKAADRRPYAFDPSQLIERATRVPVSGLEVPVLDPVDRLVTLAWHASRSGGHRLLWLKDIERCLSVEQPDLDLVVQRCEEIGLEAPVGLMLERARQLLHAPVTADHLERLGSPGLRRALRVADRISDPIRLHERPTLSRVLSRSVRATVPRSLGAVPGRATVSLADRIPRWPNETDDPTEKASYLAAVTGADR